MDNSKQTLVEALKKKLPDNWCLLLAERTGKGWATVNRVVTNLKTDHSIWPDVMKLANEHQALIKKNEEDLKNLIESE